MLIKCISSKPLINFWVLKNLRYSLGLSFKNFALLLVSKAFDTNKSAKFLNDNPKEYLRFLRTQKLIRGLDEIHLINKEKKLLFTTLENKENYKPPVDKALSTGGL